MSVRTLQNRHLPHRLGAESARRWASINLAIMLSVGYQANCDADRIAANASAGAAGAAGVSRVEAGEEKLLDPPKLLVGSPELWKFRRINVPLAAR